MAKKDRFAELLSMFSALNKSERKNALILAEAFKNKSSKDSEEAAVRIVLSSSVLSSEKEIILESLILSQNIEKPGEYSNQFRNEIGNQKSLNQASINLSRGQSLIPENLLIEVENKAMKYELFSQVTEAKELLALIYSQKKSSKTSGKYKEQLALARKSQIWFTEACNIFYDFESAPLQIEEKLTRLKVLEKNSRSVRVGFLRGLIEVDYFMSRGKLDLASKVLKSLMN